MCPSRGVLALVPSGAEDTRGLGGVHPFDLPPLLRYPILGTRPPRAVYRD